VNGASVPWWSSGGEARWNLPSEAVMLSVHVGASEALASSSCSQRPARVQATGMEVEVYCFKPSLAIDMQEADLVISHAGAGCIMESLRFVYPHLLLCDED
jgi:UDP-N-acetylglucosamine transferase subunit ALG13